MKLRNVVIVVSDIERSRQFYHDLFGLDKILASDGNMILTEGLVLQDARIWESALGRNVFPDSNSCELYFEESNIEQFAEKLERLYPDIRYVTPLTDTAPGRRIIRIYDPDGNLIEIGTPFT